LILAIAQDSGMLAELYRLADDLWQTRDIETRKLRTRLLLLEEWPGAIFELEVLASLIRCGLQARPLAPKGTPTPDFAIQTEVGAVSVESAVRGMPLPMLVHQLVSTAIAFEQFGETVITFESGFGSSGEKPHALAGEIVAGIRTLIANEGGGGLNGPGWNVSIKQAVDRAVDRTLSARWGNQEFSGMLDRHVRNLLRGKLERQLQDASTAVIAIDCRSLALGVHEQAHPFHKGITANVRGAIQQFVDEAVRQVTVLAWFNGQKFPVTRQAIVWPDQVWAFRRHTQAALASSLEELGAVLG